MKGKVPLAAVTSDRLATAGDVPIMAVHWLSSVSKSKALPILDWTFWNKPSELPGYIGIKKSSMFYRPRTDNNLNFLFILKVIK